jgi:inosine-uridine nucleoside N-ribohydrolase
MNSGAYLHDPTVMFVAIDPSLMTYAEGVVRVQADGIFRGLTLFDNMKKRSVSFHQICNLQLCWICDAKSLFAAPTCLTSIMHLLL